jgi:extracellular factor (EF) 3-hydroxypalmitic acid methyl ester biosynthesis protein
MPVTSLACGPARELFDLFQRQPDVAVEATCVDIDAEALEAVAQSAEAMQVTQTIHYIRGNLLRMANSNRTPLPSKQWLMYSLGLMDYLQSSSVVSILNWIYEWLLPGGEVIIGNFGTANPNRAFMDYVGEWVLIHRDPDELRELFRQSKFANSRVEVDQDATGIQLFARCFKA